MAMATATLFARDNDCQNIQQWQSMLIAEAVELFVTGTLVGFIYNPLNLFFWLLWEGRPSVLWGSESPTPWQIQPCTGSVKNYIQAVLFVYLTQTEKHHNTCQIHSFRSHCQSQTSWGWLARLSVRSAYRTRTRFRERGFFYSGPAAWNTLPTLMTLLIPVHSENDSSVYFLIVLTGTTDYWWHSWTCRTAASYKFCVD